MPPPCPSGWALKQVLQAQVLQTVLQVLQRWQVLLQVLQEHLQRLMQVVQMPVLQVLVLQLLQVQLVLLLVGMLESALWVQLLLVPVRMLWGLRLPRQRLRFVAAAATADKTAWARLARLSLPRQRLRFVDQVAAVGTCNGATGG